MKKTIFTFIMISSFLFAENNGETINQLSHLDINTLLREKASEQLTITQKMNFYSGLFLGLPYSWTATGDGQDALYEPWPLVNFDSTNCMVYVEHVLALSISNSWEHFFNNLQQIRYKNGEIGMFTRNHYTMADWLPENNWLLENISRDIAAKNTKIMTRSISHKQFFKSKGLEDLRYIKPDSQLSIEYIPLTSFSKIIAQIEDGDIIILLFANKKDIFAAHMLLAVRKKSKLFFREASTRTMSVIETPAQTRIKTMSNSKRYAGLSILRIKPELNKAGTHILPEDITKLKQK